MSFFQKKSVAVLLTILVVIVSTLLSINIKLGSRCAAVTEGFYVGVEANGYTQKSISSHLKNIASYADGLVTIANNYDIETKDVQQASQDLKNALRYSKGDESFIYYDYSKLISAVKELEYALGQAELNERDTEGTEQYLNSITGAQSAIESSGYNETVREFLHKYDKFPTSMLAKLAGVEMPEYFE